jgi:nitrogen regulatory protein PII
MKRIEAVISPIKLDELQAALATIGVEEVVVSSVRGIGRQPGQQACYRGIEYVVEEFLTKTRLDVFVSDLLADEVIEAILKSARGGTADDGLIIVRSYSDPVSVRVDDEFCVDGEDCLDVAECVDGECEFPSAREQFITASLGLTPSKFLVPTLHLLARLFTTFLSS